MRQLPTAMLVIYASHLWERIIHISKNCEKLTGYGQTGAIGWMLTWYSWTGKTK